MSDVIGTHTEGLTSHAIQDLVMNPRTPSFRRVPRAEITERIGALYRNLAGWITSHDDDAVRLAYEEWGRKRFTQDMPLSEIVYAVILAKQHVHRYGKDHGLDLKAVEPMITEFFDRALYYLVRGYEMQAAAGPR